MGAPPYPPLNLDHPPAVFAYVAGLVDGEGSLSVNRSFHPTLSKNFSYAPRVSITNTYEGVLEWLVETLGGRYIRKDKTQRMGRSGRLHKIAYTWSVSGKNFDGLIVQIRPYLVIKREQADLLIELASLRSPRRSIQQEAGVIRRKEEIYQAIAELNRDGVGA